MLSCIQGAIIWFETQWFLFLFQFTHSGFSSVFLTPQESICWTSWPMESCVTTLTMWMDPGDHTQTFYVLINVQDRMFMTDKRASVVLQLPEAPALNSSYLRTRYLQLNYIFLAPTQHAWMQRQMQKQNPHKWSSLWAQTHAQSGYTLGNGCLAAESLREPVACLFPPLLCFHWNVM